MERTNSSKMQRGFFSDTQLKRTKQGMSASVSKAKDDIINYMIPTLNEYGYGAKIISGAQFNEGLYVKDHEAYSKINPRSLLKDAGYFLEIWKLKDPKFKLVVKPFVIEKTKPQFLGNRPRWNLNNELYKYVKSLPEAIRVRCIHNLMFTLDLHFLIMTKSGKFWADRYTNMHYDDYYLTYRNDKHRLDRIAVKAETQVQRFRSNEKYLKDRLIVLFYYFNVNNRYKRSFDDLFTLKLPDRYYQKQTTDDLK